MEDLRSRRRLPEHADFPRYKREQLAKFTSLIEPAEDLLHLPDGTTLRMLLVPHPFGGLMFILEDVTNALALESSYNTLMAVQQESLDNLAEGIAVFGGDGRLKLSNPAYARIWNLRQEDLNGEPHLVELVEKMKHFFDYGDDWEGFKRETIAGTLERAAGNGRLERVDGSVVEFSSVPLPDGAVLTSFLDVTDSVRVEQALRERNAALEAADRLKSEFIANVSYQLRTPLNAIMGFAEILANQYFGPLNERQLEYSRAVLDSGQRLLLLINDILDLATVEAGYMVLERAPVDIPAMLGSVIGLTRDWARKQNLKLDVDYADDIGTIDADEKRLKQADLQPDQQRHQVHAARRQDTGLRRTDRRLLRPGGDRHRHRHPGRRSGTRLRPLRTRQPASPPDRRRPGPVPGQELHRTARRPRRDRQPPQRGHLHPLHPARPLHRRHPGRKRGNSRNAAGRQRRRLRDSANTIRPRPIGAGSGRPLRFHHTQTCLSVLPGLDPGTSWRKLTGGLHPEVLTSSAQLLKGGTRIKSGY